MSKKSIGIDIGLNSVKIVELTKDGKGTVRLTKAAIRYAGFDWDVFSDKRAHELASYIKRARETNKIAGGKSAVVSLPCISVFVRYIDILETKRKKEDELIEYEAQQQIPLPLEEVAWDYRILHEVKGEGKNAILIAVKKDTVDETIEIVRGGGFQAKTVTLSLLCILNVVRRQASLKDSEGIIIVDIGAESTGIVINRGRHIWLRSFTLAGKRISESIVQNADVDFLRAEAIKKTGPEALAALDEERQAKVKETIAFDLENLIGEVERSIMFYRSEHMSDDSKQVEELFKRFHIVLTGGGSRLQGLVGLFEKKLGMTVSVIDSFEGISIHKSVFRKKHIDGVTEGEDIVEQVNPLLSVAVGAALYGLEPSVYDINFLKKEIKEQKTVYFAKYLRAAAYIFFFAALIVNIFFQKAEVDLYGKRVHGLTKLAEQMDTYAPKVERLQGSIAVAQDRGVFLKNYLQKRLLWLEVMDVVAAVLPPNVWITSFQGNGVLEKDRYNELILSGVTLSYDQLNDFIIKLRAIPLIAEVKPESVVEQDDTFNFLLNVTIQNGVSRNDG